MKKIIPLIIALTLSNAFAQNMPEVNNREISPITVSANDYPADKSELPKIASTVNVDKVYNVNIFVDNDLISNNKIKPKKEFYIMYFGHSFNNEIVKDTKYETKTYILPNDNQTVSMLFKIITTTGQEKPVVCHTVNRCTVITPFKSIQEIKIDNIPVKEDNTINLNFTKAKNGLNVTSK